MTGCRTMPPTPTAKAVFASNSPQTGSGFVRARLRDERVSGSQMRPSRLSGEHGPLGTFRGTNGLRTVAAVGFAVFQPPRSHSHGREAARHTQETGQMKVIMTRRGFRMTGSTECVVSGRDLGAMSIGMLYGFTMRLDMFPGNARPSPRTPGAETGRATRSGSAGAWIGTLISRHAHCQPTAPRARVRQRRRVQPASGEESGNGGQGRNRTADTGIFSPLLYRLSYLA